MDINTVNGTAVAFENLTVCQKEEAEFNVVKERFPFQSQTSIS